MATEEHYYEQFLCPECGSHHYGSFQNQDGSWTRLCHDQNGRGCRFKWHQDDDWKYILMLSSHKCESKEEYEAELKKRHPPQTLVAQGPDMMVFNPNSLRKLELYSNEEDVPPTEPSGTCLSELPDLRTDQIPDPDCPPP